ncbi:hypothetical protein RXV95_08030 [Novosphingobium sp. ZN18A2]|uniref:hypothetical protein n=1 Tax=Novosphingobium sp. ZN18A2 TaxID=3079861 RepID=UPI0030CB97E4
MRFDLPLASSPVGTIRRTAPIASPDRALIAFTLPDVEIEQPFKQPAGATAAPLRPIAATMNTSPVASAPTGGATAPVPTIADDSASFADPVSSAGAAAAARPGKGAGLASVSTDSQQPALMQGSRAVETFDLADIPRAAPQAGKRSATRTAALAQPSVRQSGGKPGRLAGAAPSRDRLVDGVIMHETSVSLNNHIAGRLTVKIDASGGLAVRLGDLLSMVQTEMQPSAYSRLAGSSANAEYLSFAKLRSAGIDLRYDAGDDVLVISEL